MPEEPIGNADPMAAWTVVHGLPELHATWMAFGALTARGKPAPNALVPFANAVTHHGVSWALSAPAPALILLDTEGHAYRYPSGQHGVAPATEEREPVEISALEALGWSRLSAGENHHVRYAGSALHLLGALRATGDCGACHGDDNKLLGAYHYVLNEIADD